jgi:hypothetical protein
MSTCTASESCFETDVPDCEGGGGSSGSGAAGGARGGGTGGSGGHGTGASGGTTGAAGNGGTADCSVCDKAKTCCTALGLGASCDSYSAATCSASGDAATYASICQQVLTAASSNAACK